MLIFQDMERPHSVEGEVKDINPPIDGFAATTTTEAGTPLAKQNTNLMLNNPVDNLVHHTKDKNIDIRNNSNDDIHKQTNVTDDTSLYKNNSLKSPCNEQQDSSDDDDEDDEVNDLFKQIRRMSDRSSSDRSKNRSLKGSREKLKSLNPFLEPFHRHSSVDMKGTNEFLDVVDLKKFILMGCHYLHYNCTIITALLFFRCNGAK